MCECVCVRARVLSVPRGNRGCHSAEGLENLIYFLEYAVDENKRSSGRLYLPPQIKVKLSEYYLYNTSNPTGNDLMCIEVCCTLLFFGR